MSTSQSLRISWARTCGITETTPVSNRGGRERGSTPSPPRRRSHSCLQRHLRLCNLTARKVGLRVTTFVPPVNLLAVWAGVEVPLVTQGLFVVGRRRVAGRGSPRCRAGQRTKENVAEPALRRQPAVLRRPAREDGGTHIPPFSCTVNRRDAAASPACSPPADGLA